MVLAARGSVAISRRAENHVGRLKRVLKFVSCDIKGFVGVVKRADLLSLKSLFSELTAMSRETATTVDVIYFNATLRFFFSYLRNERQGRFVYGLTSSAILSSHN